MTVLYSTVQPQVMAGNGAVMHCSTSSVFHVCVVVHICFGASKDIPSQKLFFFLAGVAINHILLFFCAAVVMMSPDSNIHHNYYCCSFTKSPILGRYHFFFFLYFFGEGRQFPCVDSRRSDGKRANPMGPRFRPCQRAPVRPLPRI